MECKDTNDLTRSERIEEDVSSNAAVNSSILNYYKKFGRKRDLEQYFSLSTAQSDIRDPNSSYWSRMKQQNDTSDSGEKRSDSSTELCRISIRCTVPEPSTSQDDRDKRTPDSDSPPIITEDDENRSKLSDDEEKTDDDRSQKSADATFDTSMNKPLSPTSSVTSQRKLEWDSLADVGYGNESDRKTSVQSSLSTLERLALKQQYSNNDSKDLGLPTAHSTPLDQSEDKNKPKRSYTRTTKIHRKDVDFIEVNMPHSSNQQSPQAINVNLTKHISFNVDKSGAVVTLEDKNTKAKTVSNDSETPLVKMDRDSQTSLKKTIEKGSVTELHTPTVDQLITVPLNLNTLRRRNRKKRALRRRSNTRVRSMANKENEPVIPKTVDQVSEAESFEYMPGHIYNQNQQRKEDTKTCNTVGNKSSLESSGNVTTDSSKVSKVSFSRDLEKSCKLLKEVLKGHCDDKDLKKKLVKSVVQRLLNSQYKDDESSTDFLSGLSYNTQKLGISNSHHTTTSTSDNTEEKVKMPKKSIMRGDKFDPNIIASSSQSAPNLPVVTNQDIPVLCSLGKPILTSTTESDSAKEKEELNTTKASSEELYQKYLKALQREAAYRKHLREKENLLREKLVGSDTLLKPEARVHNRIKELMKDLTRNNYDDGSGDASKLEGGTNSYSNVEEHAISRDQRSHSVFTLNSSGASGSFKQKWNLKKRLKHEMKHSDNCKNQSCTSSSKGIYYKVEVSDSSVQVDLEGPEQIDEVPALEPIIESAKNIAHIVSDEATGDVKYVCLCPSDKNNKTLPENILIYKCSRLSNAHQASDERTCSGKRVLRNSEMPQPSTSKKCEEATKLLEKSSQTDFHCNIMPTVIDQSEADKNISVPPVPQNMGTIEEATRCLQTDITINPALIEPTLSDVNFIKEHDCAVLVSEQYKIPKAVTELICEDDSKQSLTGTSKSGMKKFLQEEQQSNEVISNFTHNDNLNDTDQLYTQSRSADSLEPKADKITPEQPVCRKDNIAIPIEGTNMTLMVTFSADARPDMAVQSQGTLTQKPEISEKATSIFEECTKSVQSLNTNLFMKMETLTLSDNKPEQVSVTRERPYKAEKYNTHPKVSILNENKPFLRSNTDPALIGASPPIIVPSNKKVDATNFYPVVVKHCPEHSCPEHSKSDTSKNPRDSSKEYETDNSSRSTSPIIPESNNPVSFKFLKKYDASGYLKMLNLKSGQKLWNYGRSPMRKGSFWKKKLKTKDSLDELREPIIDMIKAITKRFSKSSIENNEKKRLKDIISALSYLLDTDDSGKVPSASRSDTRNTSINTSHTSSNRSDDQLAESIRFAKNSDCRIVMSDIQLKPERQIADTAPIYEHSKDTCSWTGCKYCSTMKKMGMHIAEQTNYNDHMAPQSLFEKRPHSRNGRKNREISNANILPSKHPRETVHTNNSVSNKPTKSIENFDQVANIPLGEDLVLKIRCKKKRKPTHLRESRTETVTAQKDEPNVRSNRTSVFNMEDSQPGPSGIDDFPPHNTKNKSSTDDNNTVSTDSATVKMLSNIQKECDKYRKNRCKSCRCNTCKTCYSNPTSTCNICKRVHHCHNNSKGHKYTKPTDIANRKKSIAYNLILQASDSISEDTLSDKRAKQLKNIVVKVPSRRKQMADLPFNELSSKLEKLSPQVLTYEELKPNAKNHTSSSVESLIKHTDVFTVRKYLEKNRPEFVDRSTQRQNCIKLISEKRASQREAQRRLLSLHVDNREALSNLTMNQLRMLAEDLGIDCRKKEKPKFICETEMKKHSERIYKTLPEVTKKKEEQKKDNIKKTNLLMADIFKKNLQRKTLQGNVNLSNYSAVLKL